MEDTSSIGSLYASVRDGRYIPSRKKVLTTLETAINCGFRSTTPLGLVTGEGGEGKDEITILPGLLGSDRRRCTTVIKDASVGTAQLYVSINEERRDMLQVIDSEWKGKNISIDMILKEDFCKGMMEISNYSSRRSIEVMKGDVIILDRNVFIQIIEFELEDVVINEMNCCIPRKDVHYMEETALERLTMVTYDRDKEVKVEGKKNIKFNSEIKSFIYGSDVHTTFEIYDQEKVMKDIASKLPPLNRSNRQRKQVKYLKVRIVDSVADKNEIKEFNGLPFITFGSNDAADCKLNNIKSIHGVIESKLGKLYYSDICGTKSGSFIYLTRPITLYPGDLIQLGDCVITIFAQDMIKWQNAILIASKMRETSRESTVPFYSQYYPKLVLALGMQSFFAMNYVIGYNELALLSVRDLQLAGAHTVISSLKDEKKLLIEPLIDTHSKNTRIIIGQDTLPNELTSWKNELEYGIILNKYVKFQIGSTIFEIVDVKSENDTGIVSRHDLNKGIVSILRKMKEFRLFGRQELHTIAMNMIVHNLDTDEELKGDLENNYYIIEAGGPLQLSSSNESVTVGQRIGKGPEIFRTREYIDNTKDKNLTVIGKALEPTTVFVLSSTSILSSVGPLEGVKGNIQTVYEGMGVMKQIELRKIQEEIDDMSNEDVLSKMNEIAHKKMMRKSQQESLSIPYHQSRKVSFLDRVIKSKSPVIPVNIKRPSMRGRVSSKATIEYEKMRATESNSDPSPSSPSSFSMQGTNMNGPRSGSGRTHYSFEKGSLSSKGRASIGSIGNLSTKYDFKAEEKMSLKSKRYSVAPIAAGTSIGNTTGSSSKDLKLTNSEPTDTEKLLEVQALTGRKRSMIYDAVVIDSSSQSSEKESILLNLSLQDALGTETAIELIKNPYCYIEMRACTGPVRGTTYYLNETTVTIGRSGGDANIQIPDSSLNYLHACISYSEAEGRYYLKDLKTRNGTSYLLRKGEVYLLQEGEIFHCGETQFRVLGQIASSSSKCCSIM